MPRPQAMERIPDTERTPVSTPEHEQQQAEVSAQPQATSGQRGIPRALLPLPQMLIGVPDKYDEWIELTDRDRRILTDEVLQRWAGGLLPEDYTLQEVANLEHRRQVSLRTMRQGAELTDNEHRLLRFFQRHEKKIVNYLQMAQHMWQTPQHRITARSLATRHGYAAPEIAHLHMLVSQLRRKLEIDMARPQHIATVKGVGYVYYSSPPAINDGINYEARRTQAHELREIMQTQFGIVEGSFVATTDEAGFTSLALLPDDSDEAPPGVGQGRLTNDPTAQAETSPEA